MLIRFDPFRELNRLTEQMWGTGLARWPGMSMDAYRRGDEIYVHFDVPGVDPESIDLTIDRDVLTVTAERRQPWGDDVEVLAHERPEGRFTRQLFLGEGLDLDRIDASYDGGVLTLRIPVADEARPRKVQVAVGPGVKAIEAEASAAA